MTVHQNPPMQPFSSIEPDPTRADQLETKRWVVWIYPSAAAFMNAPGPTYFDNLLKRYGYLNASGREGDLKNAKLYKTKGAATTRLNYYKARERDGFVYEVSLKVAI